MRRETIKLEALRNVQCILRVTFDVENEMYMDDTLI